MWCLVDLDAAYLTNREDVLALYERAYWEKEPVVCLDEKPVSLHAEVRTPRPARPGHVAKRDTDYRCCGTANIFGVVEPKVGRHSTCATPDRTSAAFVRMIGTIMAAYPAARTIYWVMVNLNTHREKALTDHFGLAEGHRLWQRLAVHYPPKHGSWLNQAEIERSLVSRQCLGTRRIDALGRCAPKCARGPVVPTGERPRSTGASHARTPDARSDIQSQFLNGQRPRCNSNFGSTPRRVRWHRRRIVNFAATVFGIPRKGWSNAEWSRKP
ncbi:transposase [Gemmatimonas sp.]|uniref:transposase n=1 Tax=Gemmatimonas sp. TaxID=1962908 RepID=UPI003563889C